MIKKVFFVFLIVNLFPSLFFSYEKYNAIRIGETGATLIALNYKEKNNGINVINYSPDTKLISIEFLLDNSKGSMDLNFSYLSGIGIKLQDQTGYYYTAGINNYSSEIKPLFPINENIKAGRIVKGWITFEVSNNININEVEFCYEDSYNIIFSEWGTLKSINKYH